MIEYHLSFGKTPDVSPEINADEDLIVPELINFRGRYFIKPDDIKAVTLRMTANEGTGKPEPLKFDLCGYWSRSIDQDHRLVYRVDGNELHVLTCKFHIDFS